MKRVLIATRVLLIFFLPSSSFAQAYFKLNNRDILNGIDAPVFDAEGRPIEGSNFTVGLYGGANPTDLTPAIGEVSQSRVVALFRLNGYFETGIGVIISKVPPGDWAWLQIRAWDRHLGVNYEVTAARGLGGYGESPLFYAQGGVAGHLDVPRPLVGLKSFSLRPGQAVLLRNIRSLNDQIILEWHPGFPRYQLQQTVVLGQPWQNVGETTTATSITNSISGDTQFFRVIGLLE